MQSTTARHPFSLPAMCESTVLGMLVWGFHSCRGVVERLVGSTTQTDGQIELKVDNDLTEGMRGSAPDRTCERREQPKSVCVFDPGWISSPKSGGGRA